MSKQFATVSSLCKTRRPLCVSNCNIQSVTPKCTPLSHLGASFKCGSTNTEKLKPYLLLATCLQRASTLSLDVRAPLMSSLAGRRRTQRIWPDIRKQCLTCPSAGSVIKSALKRPVVITSTTLELLTLLLHLQ